MVKYYLVVGLRNLLEGPFSRDYVACISPEDADLLWLYGSSKPYSNTALSVQEFYRFLRDLEKGVVLRKATAGEYTFFLKLKGKYDDEAGMYRFYLQVAGGKKADASKVIDHTFLGYAYEEDLQQVFRDAFASKEFSFLGAWMLKDLENIPYIFLLYFYPALKGIKGFVIDPASRAFEATDEVRLSYPLRAYEVPPFRFPDLYDTAHALLANPLHIDAVATGKNEITLAYTDPLEMPDARILLGRISPEGFDFKGGISLRPVNAALKKPWGNIVKDIYRRGLVPGVKELIFSFNSRLEELSKEITAGGRNVITYLRFVDSEMAEAQEVFLKRNGAVNLTEKIKRNGFVFPLG